VVSSDKSFGYDSRAPRLNLFQTIRQFYRHRELLVLLVERDLKSRYRRSILGILWTLINPIITSLVLWIVFVSVFKSNFNNGTQFAPYLLAGILTISFFNQGVMQAAESISNGLGLFLKVRVEPQLFAISSTISNSINFYFGIVALAIVSWVSGSAVSAKFPLVVIVGLSLTIVTTGLGLMLSILFIRFDDSKYVIAIMLQLLTYLTPVFYPKDILNPPVRFLVTLNPLSSFLDVFRYVFNGTEMATAFDWTYMFGTSIFIFILGIFIFRKFWAKTVVML